MKDNIYEFNTGKEDHKNIRIAKTDIYIIIIIIVAGDGFIGNYEIRLNKS